MPDLNNLMTNVQKQGSELQERLQNLLMQYEELYRESNSRFMSERLATGNMDGLEDFHRLVQIIRRNRDVIGSLNRGLRSIRSMEKFKFVEQNIPEKRAEAKPKRRKKKLSKKKMKKLTIPKSMD